jgi:EmrB/QacA subfamily drug resistance transporter
VCAASIFLFVVDAGLVALSLPKIEAEFSTSARSTLAWVASGFLVAQASMLLLGGRLGDRRGRKRFYLFGLLVFSVASGLAAVAPNVPTILMARVLGGLGAGFMTSSALALVLPMFPPSKVPKAIGTWGAVGSVAAWLTPTAGAYVVEANWRFAFAMVTPFGLVIFWLGRKYLVEQKADDQTGRTDRLSYYIGPPSLGLLVLVMAQARHWGWTSRLTSVLGTLAVAMLTVFIHRCRTADTPLLDLAMFRIPAFVASLIGGTLQQIGFFGWFVTGPLIMHSLWGWSVRDSGFALALGQVLASAGSPLGGWLVTRFGSPRPIVGGAIITGGGALWLAFTASDQAHFWYGYLPAALLFGFGGGVCGTVCTGWAMASLPDHLLGAGNSVVQLVRRMGGALGVALAVALLGEGTGHAILAGARHVWAVVGLVHLLMILPTLWAANHHRTHR